MGRMEGNDEIAAGERNAGVTLVVRSEEAIFGLGTSPLALADPYPGLG